MFLRYQSKDFWLGRNIPHPSPQTNDFNNIFMKTWQDTWLALIFRISAASYQNIIGNDHTCGCPKIYTVIHNAIFPIDASLMHAQIKFICKGGWSPYLRIIASNASP